MIVHAPSRHLVLNLRHPGMVVGVIPRAREIELRGHKFVAVPHGLDEARVLRNLGVKAPSPIEFYYDFPNVGKPPMVHQKITAGFLTLNKRAYVLNEMGTAKTLCILWAWHYLRKIGHVDALIVMAPLSTLERTWGDEIFSNFGDVNFTVLHGDQERRLKRAGVENDIYIINHDGIKNGEVARAIMEKIIGRYGPDRTIVAIDETDAYTNAQSDRWEAAKNLTDKLPWLWGASGSPTPTKPTDAWAQCRLITPWTVPSYYSRFRNRTMFKISGFRWVAKADANEEVMRVMQPAIRFKRSECFDLPPILKRFEHVELTPEQKRAYNDMMRKSKTEIDEGQVIALNEGVKLQKAVQIACGVVYGADEERYMLPVTPRLELVKRLIAQSVAKVIVFVPLTGALDLVAEELRKEWEVVVVDGRVGITEKNNRFSQFKDGTPHVLLAQPGCMSHGLNLAEASTIIWYCPTNSNRIYTQANDRIPRPGQKNPMFIVQIEGTSVEREMYGRLDRQGGMQGALLAAYERQRTEGGLF